MRKLTADEKLDMPDIIEQLQAFAYDYDTLLHDYTDMQTELLNTQEALEEAEERIANLEWRLNGLAH